MATALLSEPGQPEGVKARRVTLQERQESEAQGDLIRLAARHSQARRQMLWLGMQIEGSEPG